MGGGCAGEVEEGALQPELAELIALKSQLPPDMFGKFRDQQENLIDTARPALPTKRGNPVGSPMRRAQDAVRLAQRLVVRRRDHRLPTPLRGRTPQP